MITKLIKGQDLFGLPVQLHFNNKGPYHRTILGGLFSILIKLFMAFYIYIMFKKMIYFEDNKLSTVTSSQDYDKLGEVDMSEMDFDIFLLVQDRTHTQSYGIEDLEGVLTPYALNYIYDLENGNNIQEIRKIPVRNCTLEDF